MGTGNSGYTAAHHAAHFIRRSQHVTQQNLMQQMRRGQFFPVVQAVVDAPATLSDYQKLAEIVQDALEQHLKPDQIEARIRETTPFSALTQYMKDNHLTILSIVLTIVLYILSQQQPTKVEIVKPSIEDIIKQLEDHAVRENPPSKPIPTPSVTDKKPPPPICH